MNLVLIAILVVMGYKGSINFITTFFGVIGIWAVFEIIYQLDNINDRLASIKYQYEKMNETTLKPVVPEAKRGLGESAVIDAK